MAQFIGQTIRGRRLAFGPFRRRRSVKPGLTRDEILAMLAEGMLLDRAPPKPRICPMCGEPGFGMWVRDLKAARHRSEIPMLGIAFACANAQCHYVGVGGPLDIPVDKP